MAGYALPAPITIDKNIRKPALHRRFSVIAPVHCQPSDISEIPIHVGMHVQQFIVNTAPIRGTRQHCGAVDQ